MASLRVARFVASITDPNTSTAILTVLHTSRLPITSVVLSPVPAKTFDIDQVGKRSDFCQVIFYCCPWTLPYFLSLSNQEKKWVETQGRGFKTWPNFWPFPALLETYVFQFLLKGCPSLTVSMTPYNHDRKWVNSPSVPLDRLGEQPAPQQFAMEKSLT